MPFHSANSGTRFNLHIQSHTYSASVHTVSHIIPKKVTHCHSSHLAVMQLCIKQAQGDHGWRARIQAKKQRKRKRKNTCAPQLQPWTLIYFFHPTPAYRAKQTAFHSQRKSICAPLKISHLFLCPSKQTSIQADSTRLRCNYLIPRNTLYIYLEKIAEYSK